MTRFVPAALELTLLGALVLLAGLALNFAALAAGLWRPAVLGAAVVLAAWLLAGARAVSTSIRLALPAPAGCAIEESGATALRVVALQVAPLCGGAAAAGALAAARVPEAPSAAAGALAALGLAGLLAAARVRRDERSLGRRLLRERRWGAPLGRRSLSIESRAPEAGGARAAAVPWSAHRPPPRPQRSAVELEPVNPPARHPVGVSPPRGRREGS